MASPLPLQFKQLSQNKMNNAKQTFKKSELGLEMAHWVGMHSRPTLKKKESFTWLYVPLAPVLGVKTDSLASPAGMAGFWFSQRPYLKK